MLHESAHFHYACGTRGNPTSYQDSHAYSPDVEKGSCVRLENLNETKRLGIHFFLKLHLFIYLCVSDGGTKAGKQRSEDNL